jgi:hypothetical protein
MLPVGILRQFDRKPSELCSDVVHKNAKALLEAAEDRMAKRRGQLRNAAAAVDDDDYLDP